jgi:hypothetical protein
MYKIKYRGISKGGKITLDPGHLEAYNAAVRRLEGQKIEVTICKRQKANTRSEQKYFYAVIVKMIADEIGESETRAFEIIQAQFFEYEDANGRKYIRSTALGEWTTVEWESRMQDIRQWAQDYLNLTIPTPNETDY